MVQESLVKSFSPETEDLLKGMDYALYEVGGKSLRTIREMVMTMGIDLSWRYGLGDTDCKSVTRMVEEVTSRRQIAVLSGQLPTEGEIKDLSLVAATAIPGVRLRQLSAADTVDLILKHHDATGLWLVGRDRSTLTTSQITFWSSSFLVTVRRWDNHNFSFNTITPFDRGAELTLPVLEPTA